jgi:hypothetical protein
MFRIALFTLIAAGFCVAQEGTRVYIARCQQCHDQNSDAHAPLQEAFAAKPWEDIVKSLETGAMRAQGAQLTPEERRAVARYLGNRASWVVRRERCCSRAERDCGMRPPSVRRIYVQNRATKWKTHKSSLLRRAPTGGGRVSDRLFFQGQPSCFTLPERRIRPAVSTASRSGIRLSPCWIAICLEFRSIQTRWRAVLTSSSTAGSTTTTTVSRSAAVRPSR